MSDDAFLDSLANSAFVQVDEGEQHGQTFWVLNIFGIRVFGSVNEDETGDEHKRLYTQLCGMLREAYARGCKSTRS